MEPQVPDKGEIIACVQKLSSYLGKENVCVRYDPILLNSKYDVDYHIRAFNKLYTMLKRDMCLKLIVSFVDDYKNCSK